MALPDRGCFSYPHRRSSKVSSNWISSRSISRAIRVYRLWGRDECHIKTYKGMIWTRAFKSQTLEGIFPTGAEKREYQPICRKGGTMI